MQPLPQSAFKALKHAMYFIGILCLIYELFIGLVNHTNNTAMDAVHDYGPKSGCQITTGVTISFQSAKTFYVFYRHVMLGLYAFYRYI